MAARVRRPRRSTLALLVLAATALVAPGAATASCVGPELHIVGVMGEGPPTVRSGEAAEVRGSYFVEGCNDTPSTSTGGCSARTDPEPVRLMENVDLVIRQRHHEWTLATDADADSRGRIAWSVTIPRGVRPGPATLLAGTARLRIAVSSHAPD